MLTNIYNHFFIIYKYYIQIYNSAMVMKKNNKNNISPFVISIKETFKNNISNKNEYFLNQNQNNFNLDFSPLSGSEPQYQPYKWNLNKKVKNNHNCYAYVINNIKESRIGKPQPGYFANLNSIKRDDYNCESFYKRLKKDNPSLYLIDFETGCRKGFHKGFIALDKKKEDTDYHFYRQDKNGYWSHKPGRTEVINTDASGKKIKNPALANRNYQYFNYSTPCFFFCVNSALSRANSRM